MSLERLRSHELERELLCPEHLDYSRHVPQPLSKGHGPDIQHAERPSTEEPPLPGAHDLGRWPKLLKTGPKRNDVKLFGMHALRDKGPVRER